MSFDFHEATALFGGSFHPPHLAHQQAIQGLLKNPGVKRIVLLPSYGTPLKKVPVSFDQRMEMTKLAFAHTPSVEISDFEKQNQTEFTWQVLEKISGKIPNPVFVIGADQFQKLDQWAHFPQVLGMCDWIILLRKPHTLSTLSPKIRKFVQEHILTPTSNEYEFMTFGKKLIFVTTDAPEVSSTWLREQIALNKWSEVQDFIAPPVKDYILRNKLYGT